MVHPKVKAGKYKYNDYDEENSLSSVGSNDNDEIDSNNDAAPSTKNSKRPRSVKQIHQKKKKNDNSDDDDEDEPPEKRLRIRIRRQSNSLPISHNKSPLAQKQPRTGSDDESDDDDDE